MATITTARLLLRPWTSSDRAPFAALNADPVVMRFIGPPLTRSQSDRLADRVCRLLEEHGWGLWAVEVPGELPFAGFVGLSPTRFDTHFTPAVEIGWRLARSAWGQGHATEAARAALDHGFGVVGLPEIVSFTIEANRRSRAVMERIGMHRDPNDDFDHPGMSEGHPLRRHVLYRLTRHEWVAGRVV
jgi:RimJ/RimL family protein N-acetyltransferase